MISNKFIISGIAVSLVAIGVCAYRWKSPEVNWKGEQNLYQYLQQNPYKSETINSIKNTFQVDYVPNASTNCINPHFPVIRITTKEKHNAWIQIVHTDTQAVKWQKFVDTTADTKTFPFYSCDQDFYDAPLWTYTLFNKPVSFWKGHAYAIQVDHENKTIQCLGGIEWGFTLSTFKLRPSCITPRALHHEEWKADWNFFQKSLPGYTGRFHKK